MIKLTDIKNADIIKKFKKAVCLAGVGAILITPVISNASDVDENNDTTIENSLNYENFDNLVMTLEDGIVAQAFTDESGNLYFQVEGEDPTLIVDSILEKGSLFKLASYVQKDGICLKSTLSMTLEKDINIKDKPKLSEEDFEISATHEEITDDTSIDYDKIYFTFNDRTFIFNKSDFIEESEDTNKKSEGSFWGDAFGLALGTLFLSDALEVVIGAAIIALAIPVGAVVLVGKGIHKVIEKMRGY